jgi:glycosyltransferase involved in cell wall biosynthesis
MGIVARGGARHSFAVALLAVSALMKLAFLTHEPFFPPSGGGSAEAVYLVQEMVRRGHAVHIFCPRTQDCQSVQRTFGVQLHQFTLWRMGRYTPLRNFKYLIYPYFLQRLVEPVARRAELDLLFSQHSIAAVTAGRLKRSLRLPLVMNFLDYLTAFMETWPAYLAPRSWIAALERFELSLPSRFQADAILTVSDKLADYFAEAGYPRERIQPLYFGYDADLFKPAEGMAQDFKQSRPVVVMHGSLDHHHLGPIAAGAMAQVARARPETVFRFVGKHTAALEKFLRRARKQVPGATVDAPGFVPYAEVARQLASATVGIVPYEESTGVHCAFVAKVVEYLGLGLPAVSTPLESIQRYFRNEPLVRFAGFDGRSFGEQILHWFAVPLEQRQAWGRAASQRVRAQLDWRVLSRRAVDWVEETYARTRRTG